MYELWYNYYNEKLNVTFKVPDLFATEAEARAVSEDDTEVVRLYPSFLLFCYRGKWCRYTNLESGCFYFEIVELPEDFPPPLSPEEVANKFLGTEEEIAQFMAAYEVPEDATKRVNFTVEEAFDFHKEAYGRGKYDFIPLESLAYIICKEGELPIVE